MTDFVPTALLLLFLWGTCPATPLLPTTSPLPPSAFDLHMYLPPDWNTFCDVHYDTDPDVNATVTCNVTGLTPVLWRLQDLRNSLNATFVESARLEIAVKIECEAGGTISLPFPFRAPGLAKLTVLNCRLLDQWTDINSTAEQLGDWLRVMDIENCVWLNDPAQLQHWLKNSDVISSHYNCAQDSTLVTHIYRNVSNMNLPYVDPCEAVYPTAFEALNLTYPSDLGHVLDSVELFDKFLEYSIERGGLFEECALNLEPFRSIHFDFGTLAPTESQPEQTTSTNPNKDVLDTYIQLRRVDSECRYEHLQLVDESYSPFLIREHFQYLVENTVFPQLRILNFSHTGLTEVPREIREWRRYFAGSQLEVIDLSSSYIHEIGHIPPDFNVLDGVTTTLDLRFNRISEFTLQMLESWALVPDFLLDVRNNPIDCVCDVKDLITQLRNETRFASPAMKHYKQQILDMTCATPSQLSGRPVSSLTLSDLQCPVVDIASADMAAAVTVLVVVVVVLLILLVVAVRYRREVRILMYTRVHILLPCGLPRQPPVSSQEKTFDAFVAYAHQDSDWVVGSLLKRLEDPSGNTKGRRPCKLCIHQRDFVVGKPIIDNIVDSIAASRHTIVVLTNSFIKSGWAMEELQQAYHQSLEERSRHLVVVVLEKVEDSNMGAVLRRCCKTFTYLHVSDSLFWDRLLYSIHIGDDRNGKVGIREPSVENKSAKYAIASHEQGGQESCDVEGEQCARETDGDKDKDFNKMALFTETFRTVSVDSAWTTASTATDDLSMSWESEDPHCERQI